MIKAAAIHYKGTVWTLPAPCRHHHIIGRIVDEYGDYVFGESVQGFITEAGIFVGREAAKDIAVKHGQILPGRGTTKELYSEDLW